MGRIADWPGSSERTAKIIAAVLIALILAFIVVRFFAPEFGNSEGRHDMVEVGEPIDILVKRAGNERVEMTVTSIEKVTEQQREQWRIEPSLVPVGGDDDFDDNDIYFVRYTVSSDDIDHLAMVPRLWRLLDDDGDEYEGSIISVPEEAECPRLDGMGDGCAIIAVPEGVEITMVRFYGVARDRKILTGEN